jgi:hypothetical protein
MKNVTYKSRYTKKSIFIYRRSENTQFELLIALLIQKSLQNTETITQDLKHPQSSNYLYQKSSIFIFSYPHCYCPIFRFPMTQMQTYPKFHNLRISTVFKRPNSTFSEPTFTHIILLKSSFLRTAPKFHKIHTKTNFKHVFVTKNFAFGAHNFASIYCSLHCTQFFGYFWRLECEIVTSRSVVDAQGFCTRFCNKYTDRHNGAGLSFVLKVGRRNVEEGGSEK